MIQKFSLWTTLLDTNHFIDIIDSITKIPRHKNKHTHTKREKSQENTHALHDRLPGVALITLIGNYLVTETG